MRAAWSRSGRRVAEMQLALASRDDLTDFAPEPITAADVRRWTERVLQRAERTLDELARRRKDLKDHDGRLVDELLSRRQALPDRLGELLPASLDAMKIRHHGDFHLGQMLIVKDDVFIIDFEGEPRRSLEERRRKAPAARDVAGLIRSIDYSATAALERALKSAPDEQGRLARALDGWREHSVAAFLAAYRQASGGCEALAAVAGRRRPAARFLSAGEGVLRNRIRAGAPARLAAGAAGRHLAHPHPLGGDAAMSALSPEAYAVIEGRHSDPFHYLGPHVEGDVPLVRVFLPDAEAVAIVDEQGHESDLERVHDAGLFEGRLSNGSRRYRVRARYGERAGRDRGPVSVSSDPVRCRPLPAGRRARTCISTRSSARIPMVLDERRGRRLRGVRARPRGGSAWSAISICGTAGATPCACAATASGKSSCPEPGPATNTSTRSSGRTAACCR